jgi:hypothetical protein
MAFPGWRGRAAVQGSPAAAEEERGAAESYIARADELVDVLGRGQRSTAPSRPQPLKEPLMRRLLVTTLLAAAALGGTARATDPIGVPSRIDCYGVVARGTEAGVCAGIVCWDLCGPRLVLDPYCRQAEAPYLAACVLIDQLDLSESP